MHEVQRLFKETHKSSANVALRSPPDVFAVCAFFAKVTGCYRIYSTNNPKYRRIALEAAEDGIAWRKVVNDSPAPNTSQVPARVLESWKYISRNVHRELRILSEDETFVLACMSLIVATDVACEGIGIPSGPSRSYFEATAEIWISKKGTLCRSISETSLRVLPKQHTPHSGYNLRSLTHHLALCTASEVRPVWTQMPVPKASADNYNVLLAPWPLRMDASDIKPAQRKSGISEFGYFTYEPRRPPSELYFRATVRGWFQRADALGQRIDLVVFPEAALSVSEWKIATQIANDNKATIVAGVHEPADVDGPSGNSLRVKTPLRWQREIVQWKHHRWQLSDSQIRTYGFGGTLSTSKSWWEHIAIYPRELNFLSIRPELVICALICEDLARQDPVAELVRSVGPNLVIALLMDGPQLAERWSARYATVLADDPGSSVLTITSLGMVKLSRPMDRRPSTVVASWKDAFGSFVPLSLDGDETALILNLQFRPHDECTVDGRKDGGVSRFPVLCGLHRLTTAGEKL